MGFVTFVPFLKKIIIKSAAPGPTLYNNIKSRQLVNLKKKKKKSEIYSTFDITSNPKFLLVNMDLVQNMENIRNHEN